MVAVTGRSCFLRLSAGLFAADRHGGRPALAVEEPVAYLAVGAAIRHLSRCAGGADPSRSGQSHSIALRHLDADPMTIVRRIYEFADLELVPAVAAAMAARIAAKPELSHGMHRYDAADYGLTEDDIREQFGAYMDSFDLHPKEDPVA